MATARNLHLDAAVTHAVTLLYSNNLLTVNMPAFNINGDLDSVTFTNNSTIPLNIVFAGNPPGGTTPALFTFANFPNLYLAANGGTSGVLYPQYRNGGVNYTVHLADGTKIGDTYAIASGTPPQGPTPANYGPMVVTVNGTTCSPQTVVVPLGGTILFYSTDNKTHAITWGPNAGNPFPGLTTVYPQGSPSSQPYVETSPINDFPYTMGPGLAAGGSGGTVKVKGASR